MNRTFSRVVLSLLVLAAAGILTGGVAPPPGTTQPGVVQAQVALPTQCLLLDNIGACVNCCKDATDVPHWVCARFCKIVRFPPPPPPEPQP